MSELRKDPRLRKAVEGLNTLLDLRLGDIMQTDLITLDADDLLATAARTLIENKLNGIVVLKNNRCFTVLNSWDLLHQSYLETFSDKMDYLKSSLEEMIDEPKFESLPSTATLANAVSVIARTNYRTIPIVDDGEVVGVVSLMDIIKTYDRLILTD